MVHGAAATVTTAPVAAPFGDHVGVAPLECKRADTRSTHARTRCFRTEHVALAETTRAAGPLEGPPDVRIDVAQSRQDAHARRRLDRSYRVQKPDGTGARLGVQHGRLGRLQPEWHTRRPIAAPKDGPEGADLDRIPERRPRTVHLHDMNCPRSQARRAQRGTYDLLLCRPVGRGQRAAPTVLQGGTPGDEDDRRYLVRAHRIDARREKMDDAALRPAVPVGPRVEGLAAAVRGQHGRPRQHPGGLAPHQEVDPARERVLRSIGHRARDRDVHANQGRRARRVDALGGPLEVKRVAHTPRQDAERPRG